MLSLLIARPRRLTRIQCVAVWVCAFSLVLLLANRFPPIAGKGENSWVPSAPSHITAKVMAKDFFSLQPPVTGNLLVPRAAPSPLETREEHPFISISRDNRLFIRPPPAA